jgi:hypothetical protein
MKPKMYLHSLIGISTLFIACNRASAQYQSPPEGNDYDYDYAAAYDNGIQGDALTIAREGNRVHHYRWGVFEVPPVDIPATDSKGAVVKRVDAPSVCNERWEVFASAYWFTQKVDQQLTRFIPESDVDMWSLNAGARYRINDSWSVGGQVGFNDANIDMKVNGFKFAKVEVDTWAFTPFVNFEQKNLIAGADFEAQLQYTYGSSHYENNIFGLTGNRGGYSNTVELTTGLVWTSGDLHHGPVLGARYTDAHVDAFTLNPGPIAVGASCFESLASILGYELSYDIKVGGGKIVPAVSATWEHEYRANYHNVVAGVPNGTTAKDTAVLGAGVGWYGNCGWNVVLDYEARLNNASTSNFVGLKVGKTF